MASIKISELNELSNIEDEDLIPIVDLSANETKKISANGLLKRNYSANEIKTNMNWINGKPIYRKVISVNSLTPQESDYLNIPHGISNIDKIVSIKCIANNGDGHFFDFNNYNGEIRIFIGQTDILCIGTGIINYVDEAYFVLEYTKTTN